MAKPGSSSMEKGLFEEAIQSVGLRSAKEGTPGFAPLDSDHTAFQRALCAVVDDLDPAAFVVGFEEFTKNAAWLRQCLLPLPLKSAGGSAAKPTSLCRALLSISRVQPHLASALLERLPEFATPDDDEAGDAMGVSVAAGSRTQTIAQLLINQFRWLDHVEDPEELASKLLELVDVLSRDVKRDLVLCLPDVIDDRAAETVVRWLRGKLEDGDDPELTVPILDALSNLCLAPEDTDSVRTIVLSGLDSHEPESMPVVVKFILQSITSDNATKVLGKVRTNLALESLAAGADDADAPDGDASPPTLRMRHFAIQTLEALKAGVRFQQSTTAAWLKVIAAVDTAAEHRMIDIFVLLMVHELISHKKATEALFLKKAKRGLLTPELIHTTFAKHWTAARKYFHPLLSVAEYLMRSADSQARLVATAIYTEAFRRFEPYCQQEVLGALITHIGSSSFVEVDGALNLLSTLVAECPGRVYPYFLMLKSVLDYIDNLSVPQVRTIFRMLCDLGVSDTGGEVDEIHIFIRKMLAKGELRDARVGVVGVVAMLQSYATMSPTAAPMDGDDAIVGAPIDGPRESLLLLKVVKERFIDAALDPANRRPFREDVAKTLGLFCDEVARAISDGVKFATPVFDFIDEHFGTAVFQELYLVAADEPVPAGVSDTEVPMTKSFDLTDVGEEEESAEDLIHVNVLPLMLTSDKEVHRDAAYFYPMCPLFNLLQAMEKFKAEDNSLGEVDALLSCGMWSVTADGGQIRDFEYLAQPAKDTVCHFLLLALNWFRESIGAFADQPDPDDRHKVARRIGHIVEVEHVLAQCLAANPSFCPPEAHFETDHKSEGKGGKGKAKRAKRKKSSEEDDNDESDFKLVTKKSSKKSKKGAAAAADVVDLVDAMADDETEVLAGGDDHVAEGQTKRLELDHKRLHPCFRELDIAVFGTLGERFQTDELDTNLETIRKSQPSQFSLGPPEVCFLLRDLQKKIGRSLHPPKPTPWGGAAQAAKASDGYSRLLRKTPSEFATWVASQIPVLCDNLESHNDVFQTLLDDADGMVPDAEDVAKIKHGAESVECIESLFKCLTLFFTWRGFSDPSSREWSEGGGDLLLRVFRSIASKMSEDAQDMHEGAACYKTFLYFYKFKEAAPTPSVLVALLQLLEAVYQKYDDDTVEDATDGELRDRMHRLCLDACTRTWTRSPDKPISPALLMKLLDGALMYDKAPIETMEKIVDELLALGELANEKHKEALQDARERREAAAAKAFADGKELKKKFKPKAISAKDLVSTDLPTLTKFTFPCYYRCVFSALQSTFTEKTSRAASVFSHLASEPDSMESAFEELKSCTAMWKGLVQCSGGAIVQRALRIQVLKLSKTFVDTFTTVVLPPITKIFKDHLESAVVLFKSMQKPCRLLQRLCTYFRDDLKDEKLAGYVPQLRKSIETMVLRVQEVLLLNSCGRAVKFDQLKVKGIDGEVVSSQVPDDRHGTPNEGEDFEDDEEEENGDGDQMDEDPKPKAAPARRGSDFEEDGVDSDGTEGFEIYEPEGQ